MDVPIKPSIISEAAVNVIAFPIIRKKKLWAFNLPSEYFLHFSGAYYVEVFADELKECLRDGSCSGMRPLQYADDTVECHIGQYFGEGDSGCKHSHSPKKRFLIQAGSKLVYALLKPLMIQVECRDGHKNHIRRLKDRGVFSIPNGCKVKTSKAIFKNPRAAKILIERNTSLFRNGTLSPPGMGIPLVDTLELSLEPVGDEINRTKISYPKPTPRILILGAAITFILLVIVPWVIIGRVLYKKISGGNERSTTSL